MGHLSQRAAKEPDKPAVIMTGSGASQTFGELDAGSNRLAHLLRKRGLSTGDHYAVFAENHLRYLEACATAERAGLHVTPINSHLTPDETAYILNDCGARVLITSDALQDTASAAVKDAPGVELVLSLDHLDEATAGLPPTPIADESLGSTMFYSSGTTGRPKGIKRTLSGAPIDIDVPQEKLFAHVYGTNEHDVYLSPAPQYHAAPLVFCQIMLRTGATCVVMERFDPTEALRAIEHYQVTFSQWVPTMFVRILKLPDDIRLSFDMSSMRSTVHAAGPCPVEVKEKMIEWWGPIICEYYGGSEGNGATFLTAPQWLEHKGSVGPALLGTIRILDDGGRELPTGEIGTVWFADGPDFEYHNDPEKTKAAGVGTGRTTIGDMGYVDDDGYLYLTDRKDNMIVSGGVNIYPREIEDVLVVHPAVADVCVMGVPDDEMGESVHALVQLEPGVAATAETEADLMAHCRVKLAGFKCPRSVEFVESLNRLDTGKLAKRKLVEIYGKRGS
jgi:fatty-acyl-CoA synthase